MNADKNQNMNLKTKIDRIEEDKEGISGRIFNSNMNTGTTLERRKAGALQDDSQKKENHFGNADVVDESRRSFYN